MKKVLLIVLALTAGIFSTQAQSIGMVGTAAAGWPDDNNQTDIVMGTVDNVNFTYYSLVSPGGELKFRQDFAWSVNWGSADFPTGTGTQDGANIQVPEGIYDVTFNIDTGEYAFTAPTVTIGMVGTAADGWPNDDDPQIDVEMSSADGENYTLTAYESVGGEAKFRQNYDWTVNWGASDFPSGTATQDGANIQVPAGTYDIEFNIVTGAYSFNQAALSNGRFEEVTFSVFPNPSSDQWNIEPRNGEVITKIELFNLLGKRVLTSTSTSINANGLTSGVYLARIESQGAVSTIKLIKR
ncbi:hypothetical protein GCM10009117_02890 [Gangjinia marincola]|uniref:Secretion system C-terminal sorting domain-containing protein n=1 Tax=Gangjinia marincola TaxID=578463 RepID=A0ABP3XPG4_9FLAO